MNLPGLRMYAIRSAGQPRAMTLVVMSRRRPKRRYLPLKHNLRRAGQSHLRNQTGARNGTDGVSVTRRSSSHTT